MKIEQAMEVQIAVKHNGHASNVYEDVTDIKGIYNLDQNKLICTVSNDYTLIQHQEVVDNFKQTLQNLKIPHEIKIIAGGNNLIMDINFPEMKKLVKVGEEFTLGFRIINSYNKCSSLLIIPKFVRLACANGMVVKAGNDVTFRIRHNSILAENVGEAIEHAIHNTINTSEKLSQWVSDCMQDSIEWEAAAQIIEKLFYSNKQKDNILKEFGISRIIVKKEDGKTDVTYFSEDNTQKIDRWKIYNAITHYATHGQQITPTVESYLQRQSEKVLFTPLIELSR